MKNFSTVKILLYVGIVFLIIGLISIPFGLKNDTAILGTMYILTAIVCQTIVLNAVPLKITTSYKKEVIDLLEWSEKNIPKNNHPTLCVDFVEELRKRFDVIYTSHIDEGQVTST